MTSRWAVPVPLLPDEIISSWLVRAALTQGCDPLVLTGEIWPKWRIWTQDADRFLVDERINPICAVSGITKDAWRAATLYPVASQIFGGNPPEKALWPWMLTLGARNTRRRSGLQYCPSCFAEDARPYYRRHWRFAWHTGCEKHGCSLLDRCHGCNAPVEPHRLMAEDQQVSLCATCKADLRNANSNPCIAGALSLGGANVLAWTQSVCNSERTGNFMKIMRASLFSITRTVCIRLITVSYHLNEELPSVGGRFRGYCFGFAKKNALHKLEGILLFPHFI